MTEAVMRPEVRAFLDAMKANPRPAFTAELLAHMRGMPNDAISMLDLPVGELAVVRDVTMPVPGGEMALRMFDPRAEREPGPVMVFFHGGGFILGSVDSHAPLAAEIARQLDLPVVSVEYRLAPEHVWPKAADDAEAAARWIADNGAVFEREFTGLILCGDSAGGNLTIVTALALRDRPATLPVLLQFPIYPTTDIAGTYESRTTFGVGYGLDAQDMDLFDQHYAGEKEHWRRSPLLADQTGMPPTLIVTAEFDPLRDEGRAYAARTIAAGIPTIYREIQGNIHGFTTYRRVIPSSQADLTAILGLARAMIAESAS